MFSVVLSVQEDTDTQNWMLGPYKTLSFYKLKKGFCVCVYMNVNIIDETFEAIWNFNQNVRNLKYGLKTVRNMNPNIDSIS